MKHLKLKRGMSYSGRGVTATKAAPNVTVENDAQADELIATGYFEEDKAAKGVEVDPNQMDLFEDGFGEGHEDASESGAVELIDTLGVTKLREYAKKHGISGDWPAGTAADVIREDIRKALAEQE
ncbi:hypothetical protein [Acutalibacter muris]|uniref:hypothetical protein n=1 Tax=Acutalibacter muris TaxID=1796620 RepID=UPI000ECFE1F8|nr:hypothetical protein [Acutalibacter muris]RKJ82854.1 hypothetical protein D7X33_01235 [Butyricicoccus sp. 1XD8-22]